MTEALQTNYRLRNWTLERNLNMETIFFHGRFCFVAFNGTDESEAMEFFNIGNNC